MPTTLLWFRRDLRLTDNPALARALETGRVIPIYVHDDAHGGRWTEGAASRWWLHHSLSALDRTLRALGSRLIIRRGPALPCLRALLTETDTDRVSWNRLYDPASITRDSEIKRELRTDGVIVESFNSALLYEPRQITHHDAQPYKVFTPFWKTMQARGLAMPVQAAPTALEAPPRHLSSLPLEALDLLPHIPWDTGLRDHWQPGEEGAEQRLQHFIEQVLADYRNQHDYPARDGVSRLSPHLHFGEIGPRQILHALQTHDPHSASAESFIRQLAWREFAHHLLYHFPHTADEPLDPRFQSFPWGTPDPTLLAAWQRGQTGIPLVDAGMRELWQTGWMHNRVRMVVASFLTKNLGIHWLEGALWFWDTLVDADLANNTLGWQWTAGCGADAAPFFRIFNPVLQGKRFDPEGEYVKRWLPELNHLPHRYIHQPWDAPEDVRRAAELRLGRDYPVPIVDLRASRRHALASFDAMKSQTQKAPH